MNRQATIAEVSDLCEWDPARSEPAKIGVGCKERATVLLGNGMWRLCSECSECAALPRFSRFKPRAIEARP